MKTTLMLLLLCCTAPVLGQENVLKAVQWIEEHPEWVTGTSETERRAPATGMLLKRNRELRLSLPASQVERVLKAFEADRDTAYTFVRTSAEYNLARRPTRHVEMRLQNDVRLEAGATDYSYVLVNVLNPADRRFRTTAIFRWQPAKGGNVAASIYILYGERPTVVEHLEGKKHKEQRDQVVPVCHELESFIASHRTRSPWREMLERNPKTKQTESHTRSLHLTTKEAKTISTMLDKARLSAYDFQRSTTSYGGTVRLTLADNGTPTYRTAYVLTWDGESADLQAIYSIMPEKEKTR